MGACFAISGRFRGCARGVAAPVGVAALLLLAGCVGRPEGALRPLAAGQAAQVQGAGRVDMLVATTRMRAADEALLFTGERGADLRFADVAISIPPDAARQIGEVQWPSRAPGDPARDFVALRSARLERPQMMARLREEAGRKDGRVLLFVHGYNNRFEDAVMRFAQIAHDSRAPAAPVLFTWPSRGKLLAYTYDRESANYSRDALESVLDMLAADPAVREISVLAHSMGNWVTLEALRQTAIRRGRVHAKVANVMLAAPDVDVDVFRTQVQALGERRPQLTLFVSQDDQALGFSRRIWGNVPRVGAIDPEQEPYRSQFSAQRISVLDLTRLRGDGGGLNHDKFATSPAIVGFIGRRLAAGQRIHDGNATLGDGIHMLATETAATLGGVAAGVVAAPFKIIEGGKPLDHD